MSEPVFHKEICQSAHVMSFMLAFLQSLTVEGAACIRNCSVFY